MHIASDPVQKMYHEALIQHQELTIVTDRLHMVLIAPDGTIPESRLRRLLEYEIIFLLETLTDHFLFEEDGGYMVRIAELHPDLRPRIEGLRGEHADLRIDLANLKDGVWKMPLGKLKHSLEAILQLLARHESAESEMLNSYLGRPDTGA